MNFNLKFDILQRIQELGVTILSTPGNTAPVNVPLGNSELSALLDIIVPMIEDGITQARAAFGDRRLSWGEAAALGMVLQGIVSKAVMLGAPLVKGQDARALVLLIFGVVFDRYVTPLLPVWLKPFSGLLKASVMKGLESLYQSVIKQKQ